MQSVEGVSKATVSFADKSAEVEAAGKVCKPPGATALVEALRKAGYDGKVGEIRTLKPKKGAGASHE